MNSNLNTIQKDNLERQMNFLDNVNEMQTSELRSDSNDDFLVGSNTETEVPDEKTKDTWAAILEELRVQQEQRKAHRAIKKVINKNDIDFIDGGKALKQPEPLIERKDNEGEPVINTETEIRDVKPAEQAEVNEEDDTDADPLTKTPYIPDAVFENLPTIFQVGCNFFQDKRERDVYCTSAIAVLSGCFPKVKGYYGDKTLYANLFSFILAPPASGKSALGFARQLGEKIHDALYNESKMKEDEYHQQLKDYKAAKKNKESYAVRPQKPAFKLLFIPGDSSSAAIIDHLVNNEESGGIFIESEADAMGQSFQNKWGGYSTILRKAFQHEPHSYSRKGGSQYKEVKYPRLSVVLSGTPAQVANIIESAEDGLFSRFMFYTYKQKAGWRDITPGKVSLSEKFNIISEYIQSIAKQVNEQEPTFYLTDEQWQKMNQVFRKWTAEVNLFVSEDADSAVKRLGWIFFRIAMILSIFRHFQNDVQSKEIWCEQVDFESALTLAEVYKEHSLFMFKKLPRSTSKINHRMKRFFERLPQVFKRDAAVQLGANLSIAERTVDSYLRWYHNNNLLDKPGRLGVYQKNALADSASSQKLVSANTTQNDGENFI